MTPTYDESDLISFGQYLLSKERENSLKQTSIEVPNSLPYKKRKRWVHDADVRNWKESQK